MFEVGALVVGEGIQEVFEGGFFRFQKQIFSVPHWGEMGGMLRGLRDSKHRRMIIFGVVNTK